MVNGNCHVCCVKFIMQIKQKLFTLKKIFVDTEGVEPYRFACKANGLPLASGPCWISKIRTYSLYRIRVLHHRCAIIQYVDAIGFEPTSFTL